MLKIHIVVFTVQELNRHIFNQNAAIRYNGSFSTVTCRNRVGNWNQSKQFQCASISLLVCSMLEDQSFSQVIPKRNQNLTNRRLTDLNWNITLQCLNGKNVFTL